MKHERRRPIAPVADEDDARYLSGWRRLFRFSDKSRKKQYLSLMTRLRSRFRILPDSHPFALRRLSWSETVKWTNGFFAADLKMPKHYFFNGIFSRE